MLVPRKILLLDLINVFLTKREPLQLHDRLSQPDHPKNSRHEQIAVNLQRNKRKNSTAITDFPGLVPYLPLRGERKPHFVVCRF